MSYFATYHAEEVFQAVLIESIRHEKIEMEVVAEVLPQGFHTVDGHGPP